MADKFKNKYKIQSVRLQGYNYAQNGIYFVTICTKNREYFFGEVINGKMILSDAGKIASQFWKEIPKHFPFVNLDEYQIMPNHLHGIIEINVETPNLGVLLKNNDFETPGSGVSTDGYNKNWKPGCLGVIVNQYKRICTIEIRKQLNPITFAWQSRFYDHIIRNDASLNKIREYITSNPVMWERDRNNTENLFM
jgi:REP element-mobilizing transposase RayT